MNTFEHLLEQNEYVQKQRALGREEGFVKGEAHAFQQILADFINRRYPSLLELAQLRATQVRQAAILRLAINQLFAAPNEEMVRFILSTLPTTD